MSPNLVSLYINRRMSLLSLDPEFQLIYRGRAGHGFLIGRRTIKYSIVMSSFLHKQWHFSVKSMQLGQGLGCILQYCTFSLPKCKEVCTVVPNCAFSKYTGIIKIVFKPLGFKIWLYEHISEKLDSDRVLKIYFLSSSLFVRGRIMQ